MFEAVKYSLEALTLIVVREVVPCSIQWPIDLTEAGSVSEVRFLQLSITLPSIISIPSETVTLLTVSLSQNRDENSLLTG